MSEPARRVATYQDVLDAPEGLTAELINGELHLSPRPGQPHSAASSEMGIDLGGQFARRGGDRPGGWIFRHEPELWLGEPDPRSAVVVPDLAGWREDRFAVTSEHGLTIAPDWVCEVLSPGARNHRRDRFLKADVYHRSGVPWYWIIDPLARMIEVFRREDAGWLRVEAVTGSEDARLPPFDAVPLPIGNWWAEVSADG